MILIKFIVVCHMDQFQAQTFFLNKPFLMSGISKLEENASDSIKIWWHRS